MESEGRVAVDRFPDDCQYYTLTFPITHHGSLSQDRLIDEMLDCNRRFYSASRIAKRVGRCIWQGRQPLIGLIGNYSYEKQLQAEQRIVSRCHRSTLGRENRMTTDPGRLIVENTCQST
ncbi:TPA: hypothetical protein DCE37_16220 [Candidatus Latescibacteria bacterium]|nr:hypothetical protein [Candidatus Latescibacterota bacterium]